MPRTKVKGPAGQTITVEHPDGASDADILAYAQAHAGDAPAAEKKPDTWGDMAYRFLAGVTGEDPHALLPKNTLGDALLGIAPSATLIGMGGAGASALGAPALVGKALAGGAIGATRAATEGRNVPMEALIDAAVTVGTEGLVSGAKAAPWVGLDALGYAARGFKGGTRRIDAALEAIKARLPAGKWVDVPVLSKAKLTVEETIEKLKALRGDDYKQALAEIKGAFNKLDMQGKARVAGTSATESGPKPWAGDVFKLRAPKYRRDPSGFSEFANRVTPALTGATTRSAADAALLADPLGGGLPVGGVAGAIAGEQMGFGALARHALPMMLP